MGPGTLFDLARTTVPFQLPSQAPPTNTPYVHVDSLACIAQETTTMSMDQENGDQSTACILTTGMVSADRYPYIPPLCVRYLLPPLVNSAKIE
jgi:hypothetical protein